MTSDEKIAVIGTSGRYSGCNDLLELWQCLRDGKNCIAVIPDGRWGLRGFLPSHAKSGRQFGSVGRSVARAGCINGIEEFDAGFFGITSAEAAQMDPQHRLFLQEAYRTFEDAGYSAARYGGNRCGVYVGIMDCEYARVVAQATGDPSPLYSANRSHAIAAARVAYHFNLKGPAIAVDAACSSSLVAVHLARQALLGGDIEMALVGGVNLNLTYHAYFGPGERELPETARICRPFDDNAAGMVSGEGVGCVLMKRLSDAERANDNIHGVILKTAINHNGTNANIANPSLRGLTGLLKDFYQGEHIDPESIGYVEGHGTGTKLGDAIELDALMAAFRPLTKKSGFCAVGSIKGNIGHTNAAAGIASLHKTLLLLKNKSHVPTINYETPNRLAKLDGSPFYINTAHREWVPDTGVARRAAINSFGASGTNAHLVIEEYVSDLERAQRRPEGPWVVVLSAKDREGLRRKAEDLLSCVRGAERAADLTSLCYTLQTGRDTMAAKLGFVVSGWSSLIASLEAFLRGESKTIRGLVGTECGDNAAVQGGETTGESPDQRFESCEEIVRRWASGGETDWSALYRDLQVTPRSVSLPGYPFRAERHWFGTDDEGCSEPATIPPARSPDDGRSAAPNSAAQLRAFLRETIARLLGVPLTEVDDESDYFALGLSSQQLVALARAIGIHLARPFVSGMLFDVSTIADLAAAIAAEHADYQAAAPNLRDGSERPAASDDSDREQSKSARARISSALEEYDRGRLSIDHVLRLIDMEAAGAKS